MHGPHRKLTRIPPLRFARRNSIPFGGIGLWWSGWAKCRAADGRIRTIFLHVKSAHRITSPSLKNGPSGGASGSEPSHGFVEQGDRKMLAGPLRNSDPCRDPLD